VGFRDKLGFKDLLWSMQLKLEEKVEKYTKPKKGTKFFRGVEEYIIKE
jgi:carbamoyl-phosphate synthase large subunit